jgi:hypothetical protein
MHETKPSGERRVIDADDIMAPIIALHGLRQAQASARRSVAQIREAIRTMPQEAVPPEGQLFAVHFAENPRPASHGTREVVQGSYVASDGISTPSLEDPTRVFVRPDDSPFLAVKIATTEAHLLAVGQDGIARASSQESRDWVELVPNQTDISIGAAE